MGEGKNLRKLRYRSYARGYTAPVQSPITEEQRISWAAIPHQENREVDVVVAGGGLSGVAAAIAASRRGAKVLIVEPTHFLGGQATAAGVSAFDITHFYENAVNHFGIWSEILDRIQRIYEYELKRPVNVGHYRNESFTPNVCVVERALSEFATIEGVDVLRNTTILGAISEGARVTGLKTSAGEVHASVVIDATEDGSLLAISGIQHRIGNIRSNGITSKPAGGRQSSIQDITYAAVVREYPDGIPAELVVPVPPERYDVYLPKFRRTFPATSEGAKVRQHMGPIGFAGYRAAPDLSRTRVHTGTDWEKATRTSLNYTNDCPVRTNYFTDPEARLRYDAEARLKTIALIYYLQHELGLPWSVCTDEGFDDGPALNHNPHVPDIYLEIERHLPLIPYIRESRRLIGEETLLYKSIRRPRNRSEANWRSDCVAVGTYPPDLHGGRLPEDYEEYLGETIADKPKSWKIGPFPIPLSVLIPEWAEGFLAAEKNVSVSRLVNGSIRLHPTVVAIGEAAGVTAALAVRFNIQPRELLVSEVQYELALGGAMICPLSIEGLDKEHPDFAAVSLAVSRGRVPFNIKRPAGSEPFIRVDIPLALNSGSRSIEYLNRLQRQRLARIPS